MKKILIPILIILIAGVAWFVTREDTPVVRDEETPNGTDDGNAEQLDEETTEEVSVIDSTPEFRDGSYQSVQNYRVPNGQEYKVDVTLTLENDQIVDYALKFDDKAVGGSNSNQTRFADAIGAEISGQEIDELELSRIGGASLTTDSFNDAIDDVMMQARV